MQAHNDAKELHSLRTYPAKKHLVGYPKAVFYLHVLSGSRQPRHLRTVTETNIAADKDAETVNLLQVHALGFIVKLEIRFWPGVGWGKVGGAEGGEISYWRRLSLRRQVSDGESGEAFFLHVGEDSCGG